MREGETKGGDQIPLGWGLDQTHDEKRSTKKQIQEWLKGLRAQDQSFLAKVQYPKKRYCEVSTEGTNWDRGATSVL